MTITVSPEAAMVYPLFQQVVEVLSSNVSLRSGPHAHAAAANTVMSATATADR